MFNHICKDVIEVYWELVLSLYMGLGWITVWSLNRNLLRALASSTLQWLLCSLQIVDYVDNDLGLTASKETMW